MTTNNLIYKHLRLVSPKGYGDGPNRDAVLLVDEHFNESMAYIYGYSRRVLEKYIDALGCKDFIMEDLETELYNQIISIVVSYDYNETFDKYLYIPYIINMVFEQKKQTKNID